MPLPALAVYAGIGSGYFMFIFIFDRNINYLHPPPGVTSFRQQAGCEATYWNGVALSQDNSKPAMVPCISLQQHPQQQSLGPASL